uniref:Uncharacterized protein n=1 Tax=Arundo donax TaxID=35708 RepID=A0A0A8Y4X9_ARUDO
MFIFCRPGNNLDKENFLFWLF